MPINGQAQVQVFYVIRDDPKKANPSLANPENSDCCFELPALAQYTPTDPIYNDKHSWIQFYSEAFATANLKLQKHNGSEFVDIASLVDNTYGKFFEYGFYETIYDEKAIGYLIEWTKVLNEKGEGDYRLKSAGVQVAGADVLNYSFEFCLREYTNDRADETIRMEWYKNGNSGSLTDDKRKLDYGILNWYNAIRLPDAYFGDDRSDFEDRYVKYQNGQMTWLQLNQIEEFSLRIGLIPNYLHRFIKIDVLQSGDIFLTDYNKNNATPHVNKKVIPSSDYSPRWATGTMLAPVDLKFKQGIQNLTVNRS